jgi:hypothetical protein
MKIKSMKGRRVLLIDREGVTVRAMRPRVGGGWYVRDAITWPWPWRRL